MKKTFRYAWVILIVVSIIRGFAGPGINASSGLFLTPVSNDLNVGIGQLSIYLSISSITTLIWLPIAGNLFNTYSVRKLTILGVLLLTLSFMSLGFMNSVWGWYIMSIPLAMGAVLLVNLLGPVLVNRWFSKNQGAIMGILMTVTSLLGAVFQPILSNLIASNGWRYTYIFFGGIALIVILVLNLFLKDTVIEDVHEQEEIEDGDVKFGITSIKAIRSLPFYMLILFMVVLTGFATFSQHITTFGLGLGFSMNSIGTALSLSMIGSAIGSILIGVSSDKIGVMKTSFLVLLIAFISIALYFVNKDTYLLFALATLLHGLATSAIGVLAPILTIHFFGDLEYEKLFSYVMMGSPLASIILIPTYGFVYDLTKSYQLVFIFLAVLLVVGTISLWIAKKKQIHY